MSDAPSITYTPRPDVTPEAELDALASIYSLCLRKYRECKKATGLGGPDDAEELENDRTAESIIPSDA